MTAEQWQVYAPEGKFHGKHGHPHSYSICVESPDAHKCIALVFGETDEEAAQRATQIVAALNNRRSNLRIAGKKQNGYNRRKTLSRKAASSWNV